MLLHLGAEFQREENRLTVQGRNDLESKELCVPGDFSSAAFFMVAALLIPDSELVIKKAGLNHTRIGLLTVLQRMGAEVLLTEEKEICNEQVGNLQIRSSQLQATEIYAEEIPGLIDEIPIMAVAATQAKGITLIRGASELRVKESDRLAALATELRKMGAQIRELPDGLEITGPTKLKGTEVASWGDHRIAMALAIAGLIASGETCLEESQWVDISLPNFFELLDRISIP
jgi:3-phosphoshikimate 1-carboxyvinyltransferase